MAKETEADLLARAPIILAMENSEERMIVAAEWFGHGWEMAYANKGNPMSVIPLDELVSLLKSAYPDEDPSGASTAFEYVYPRLSGKIAQWYLRQVVQAPIEEFADLFCVETVVPYRNALLDRILDPDMEQLITFEHLIDIMRRCASVMTNEQIQLVAVEIVEAQ
jgi:hypothetical protein